MQTVAVLGGAGFIGSSVVRELKKRKYRPFVIDDFRIGSLDNFAEEEIAWKAMDIGDARLADVFSKEKVDFVINLAAEPFVPSSWERPRDFFVVNALSVINVLEASKRANIKKVVHISTSEVYGTTQSSPMAEHHPTLPHSTYGVSKLAGDRLCFTFHKEQNIPVVIVRQFNCYGERETQPYVIPEIISQLSKGPVVKLGNIKAKRDFMYVGDAAQVMVDLMERGKPGEVYNSGSGETHSIEYIAHEIGVKLGYPHIQIIVEKTRLRPYDVDELCCDPSKMKQTVRFRQFIELPIGLDRTIEYFVKRGGKWMWEDWWRGWETGGAQDDSGKK